MTNANHAPRPTQYASSADFCRIFKEDMSGLYLLSFLLTADREQAEQCFVSGLDDSVQGNPVFKEWARSWARRAIIQNAVRLINPRPAERSGSSNSNSVYGNDETLPAGRELEIASVVALAPFERFVYVMTVLEHYSDYECSLLLSCARRDVVAARTRAFQQLGNVMERHFEQRPIAGTQSSALHERRNSVLELMAAPSLATSA
jgi:hypothetical protein